MGVLKIGQLFLNVTCVSSLNFYEVNENCIRTNLSSFHSIIAEIVENVFQNHFKYDLTLSHLQNEQKF